MHKNTTESLPIVFLSYCVVLALVYAAALYASYAFYDDYPVLYKAQHNAWFGELFKYFEVNTPVAKKDVGELEHDISNGRPFMGAYFYIVFQFLSPAIASLAWLRFFALIGLVLFSSLLFLWLKRHRWPSWTACALPCCIACSPPFIVYVAWATCSFFPFGAFLAGLSYVCLERWRKDNQWLWLVLSIALLWVSLGIYQPTAMMFWLFAAVRWLSFARFDQSSMKSIGVDVAVAFLALVLAYLAFVKGLPNLLDIAPSVRSALVTQPLQKLWWFINGPLPMSAHSWFTLKPSPWLGFLLVLFGFVGLWFKTGVRDALLRNVLWIGLILLSALPSLVIDENASNYRQYAALTAVLWLGLGHAVSELKAHHLNRFFAGCKGFALGQWIMVCLAVWSAVMASYRTLHYFAIPAIREKELMAAALRKAHAQDARHLYIKADPNVALVQDPREEFGYVSLQEPYNLLSMISFLWKKQYPNEPIRIHVDPSPLKIMDYQAIASHYQWITIEPFPSHAPAKGVLLDAGKIVGEAWAMSF
jgi:hypothetical protein